MRMRLPACRRLAVAMRAAATGASREGWLGGLTFSSSVCVCPPSALSVEVCWGGGADGWQQCLERPAAACQLAWHQSGSRGKISRLWLSPSMFVEGVIVVWIGTLVTTHTDKGEAKVVEGEDWLQDE